MLVSEKQSNFVAVDVRVASAAYLVRVLAGFYGGRELQVHFYLLPQVLDDDWGCQQGVVFSDEKHKKIRKTVIC